MRRRSGTRSGTARRTRASTQERVRLGRGARAAALGAAGPAGPAPRAGSWTGRRAWRCVGACTVLRARQCSGDRVAPPGGRSSGRIPDPVALARAISLSSAPATAATAAELPHPRVGADVRRLIAGTAALVVMVLAGLAMVLTAAGGADGKVVNASQAGFPRWMAGAFGALGASPSKVRFYVLLLVMAACYFVVLAPPLLSKDIFNYIQYARLGAVHHLNPYTHGIGAAPFDQAYPYTCCHHYADPYGPLFTLGTYAIAPLGVPAMLWSLKTVVGLAGLGCVALVWKGARLQGRDPLAPALLVGLNPVWLVLTVGGAHNDLVMELFAVGGIVVWLAGRQAAGAATLVV